METRLQAIEARQAETAPNVTELRTEMQSILTASVKEVHDAHVNEMESVFAQRLNLALSDLDAVERREKRLNIIVKGIECDPGYVEQAVRDLLKEKFNIADEISSIMPLHNSQIVAVKLKDLETKGSILKRKKKALEGSNIFINSDVTAR